MKLQLSDLKEIDSYVEEISDNKHWRLSLPIGGSPDSIKIDFVDYLSTLSDKPGSLQERCENNCCTANHHFISHFVIAPFLRQFYFGVDVYTQETSYFGKCHNLFYKCISTLESAYKNYTPILFEHDVRKGKDPFKLLQSYELAAMNISGFNRTIVDMQKNANSFVWSSDTYTRSDTLLIQLKAVMGETNLSMIKSNSNFTIMLYFDAKFVKDISNNEFEHIANSAYNIPDNIE